MPVIPVSTALQRYPGARPFKFGDSNEINGPVIQLVRSGRKTVTCDAVDNFKKRGQPIPVADDISIALWNHGLPSVALRTVSVGLLPFDEMTEDLIRPQGEFSSLEDWQDSFEEYLTRAGVFTPNVLMVVETFEVIELF